MLDERKVNPIRRNNNNSMIFLIFLSISMLALNECTLNITIHDYVKDQDMVDPCKSTNYTSYCFKKGACDAGTHVMCMYYRSGLIMGPQCESGNMFKLTRGLRNTILESIKDLRDEASAGQARGKDDVLLPRAYNLRSMLIWDRDLSIFAQVWANQCRLGHDFCRSTEKFEYPDQFVGVDIFTHPEWQNLKPQLKLREMEKHCLTPSKVKDAIQAIIKLVKDEAKEVTTPDMIDNYPSMQRNSYLSMLYANATHIGCGMAYYQGYKWIPDIQKRDVLVLQLVCNLSHKLNISDRVYDTVKPVDYVEPTDPPPTTTETTTTTTTTTTTKTTTTTSTNTTTEIISFEYAMGRGLREVVPGQGPGVLIMPIITVEDAPPSKQRRPISRKASLSTYNKNYTRKQLSKISLPPRKSSIFSRVPIFNLSKRNLGKTSNESLQEKSTLKKKLKTLIEQVPSREIPRLRDLLKQIVRKQKYEENLLFSNVGPTDNVGQVVTKPQEIVSGKKTQNSSITVNVEGSNELLRLTKQNIKDLKQSNRKIIGSDVPNYADNPDIVQVKDDNIGLESPSQFHIPPIRKQKPLMHAEGKSKIRNSNQHKTLVNTFNTAVNKKEEYNLDKNTEIIDLNPDNTNFGNNVQSKAINFAGGNKISGYQSARSDIKLRRRLYLENEISKLKRKLQNLRQYIRENDINENAGMRPIVHNGQRTSKFDEKRNFYMPDRAHPLHEYK